MAPNKKLTQAILASYSNLRVFPHEKSPAAFGYPDFLITCGKNKTMAIFKKADKLKTVGFVNEPHPASRGDDYGQRQRTKQQRGGVVNTIERMQSLYKMIEPTEGYPGGSAVLTAEELGLFLRLYQASSAAEKCLNDSEKRQSGLSEAIASLEAIKEPPKDTHLSLKVGKYYLDGNGNGWLITKEDAGIFFDELGNRYNAEGLFLDGHHKINHRADLVVEK